MRRIRRWLIERCARCERVLSVVLRVRKFGLSRVVPAVLRMLRVITIARVTSLRLIVSHHEVLLDLVKWRKEKGNVALN